jgi:hypothetical protein
MFEYTLRKKLFSSLDVAASFHQVPLAPEDRYKTKTAFCTRQGQFQYKKLTMGFSSAPAAYSRLMERVLTGLLYNIAIAYIDDVVVYANSFTEMLNNLSTVFNRLRQAKLKLRPSKCQLFTPKIEFCGHIIDQQGRSIDPKRTACLEELTFPKDIHALRRLIGFF